MLFVEYWLASKGLCLFFLPVAMKVVGPPQEVSLSPGAGAERQDEVQFQLLLPPPSWITYYKYFDAH